MDEYEKLVAEGETMRRRPWADWSDMDLDSRMAWQRKAAEYMQSNRLSGAQVDRLGELVDAAGPGGQDLRARGMDWSIFRDTPSDTARGAARVKPVVDAVKAAAAGLGLPDGKQIALIAGVVLAVVILSA